MSGKPMTAVAMTAEQVSEQCTKEANKSKARMADICAENNPLNEFVWARKYKFFSNQKMKFRHGTYAKAQSDPLRGGEVTPWENSFVLPEHRWVERQETEAAHGRSSPSGDPRPPVGAPGCPTVPKKAAPPTLQPTASDEALAKTLEKVNKMVAKSPKSTQTCQRVWSKYHYFNGGGQNSDRFRLQGKDDPWAWALNVHQKHEKHQSTKEQHASPSTSKHKGRPF
jgi:hypothetical protein